MKITKKQLKQLIKEELSAAENHLDEGYNLGHAAGRYIGQELPAAADEFGRWAAKKSQDVIDDLKKGPVQSPVYPPSPYDEKNDMRNVYARLLKLQRNPSPDGINKLVELVRGLLGEE